MSLLEDLHKKLEEAIYDASRAKAAVETNAQRLSMGFEIPRGNLFGDNLRLEHTLSVVKKIEKAIASVKNKKRLTKERAKKPKLSADNFVELARIKLEERKIIDEGVRLAREAKIERQRKLDDRCFNRQELLLKKMRNIVGEDTFIALCKEVDESQDDNGEPE